MFHRSMALLVLALEPMLAQPRADIRTAASEVVLDLVARDKRGRTLRDLTAADVIIQEGGKTFAPLSLRLVTASSGSAAAANPTSTGDAPATNSIGAMLRQTRLVTFLFEPLPRESARLAKEIANELVAKASGPSVYFNVLLAREKMKSLQPFTNDPKLLNKAFLAATSTVGYRIADDMAQIAEMNLRTIALNEVDFERMLRGEFPRSQMGQGNTDPTDTIRAQQARITLNMLSLADEMQRQYQGRTSLNALRAAIRALAPMPGRKTIVYVARGITSHPSLTPMFHDLIEAANASGVSVYGVDATGLEVTERNREASRLLARAAQASMDTRAGDPDNASAVREQMKAFETAELSTQASPGTLLAELAESTGGLLVSDSNDSRKMAQMIADDISSYWEVTYKPEIETWDGSFHPIAVKINRKNVKAQTRPGYFAIPPGTNRAQVAPFEMPLLGALQAAPPPEDLRFDAVSADLLRGPDGMTRGDLTIEMPLESFEPEQDPTASQFRYRASVLALFRNAQGEIADRQSQPVNYQGPLEKLGSARQGLFHWRYAYKLAPGEYTVEIALQDRVGAKIGVRKFPLTIREVPATGLALSTISWVRPDPAPQPTESFEPLQTKDAVFTPRAARKAALAGAKTGGLPLYFIAQHEGPTSLEAEIERDGQTIAKMPIDAQSALPDAPARTTPYVVTLPWRMLEPGAYQIRIAANDGATRVTRSLQLELTAAPDYTPPIAATATQATEEVAPVKLAFSKEPVVLSNALSEADQQAAIETLRKRGAEWVRSLIDFVCLQVTERSVDRNGKGDFAKADTIREMVTYSGGKESYERLAGSNGPNYTKQTETPKGVRSFGEFGGLMRSVLSAEAAAKITWKGYTEEDGVKLHIFEYAVAQEKSMYTLTQERPFRTFKPSYSGVVLAEVDTMQIRRIKVRTSEIPDKFPFQEATHEIDYAFARIAGVSYLLPVKSLMQTRVGKRTIVRSEMQFSDYRKWGGESKIRFDTQP